MAESEQRVEGIVRRIGGLEASQHRRAGHLAAHEADRVELAEVEHVLDERLQTQITRVVKEPPTYITKTLGPRPAGGEPDRAWVRAVIEVETYRQDHNITDRRTTLGPEPPARAIFGQHEWRRVNWAIEDARDTSSPPSDRSANQAQNQQAPPSTSAYEVLRGDALSLARDR